ncbi:MAG: FKBP-type peptidyl-prolyl cis-trans isomerase, partial [Flavobacterium sp.]|nr:FKBP-type peptidyl-prolyl cis-trans isomerase [Flavobacterium sp.]
DAQHGYEPLPFQAGRKEGMIPGFLEGIDKMNLGDKAVIFIPSNLGYGAAGAGNGIIPPNSNLIFEIELLDKK